MPPLIPKPSIGDDEPPVPRPRYAYGVPRIIDALQDFFTIPSWIRYGEEVRGSKVDAVLLVKAGKMLNALKNIMPNLSFSQKDMQAAVMVLLKRAQKIQENQQGGYNNGTFLWRAITGADEEAYSKSIAKRIRTMCRHVADAEARSSPPLWLAGMPWRKTEGSRDNVEVPVIGDDVEVGEVDDDVEVEELSGDDVQVGEIGGAEVGKIGDDVEVGKIGDDVEVDETQAVAAPIGEYCFGFCSETMTAWRKKLGKPDVTRESTDVIQEPPPYPGEAEPNTCDHMIARWPDGMTKSLATCTVARWEVLNTSSSSSGPPSKWVSLGLVWKELHSVTKNNLEVRPRADRTLLCSLYEQGRQILQLNTTSLKKVTADENDQIKTAFVIMKGIAQDYRDDKITKEQLKAVRDKTLERYRGTLVVKKKKTNKSSKQPDSKKKMDEQPAGPEFTPKRRLKFKVSAETVEKRQKIEEPKEKVDVNATTKTNPYETPKKTDENIKQTKVGTCK